MPGSASAPRRPNKDDDSEDASSSLRPPPPPPPPLQGILGLQHEGNDVSGGGAMKALAGIKKLIDAAQHIVILVRES